MKRYSIPAGRRAEICRATGRLTFQYTTSRSRERYGWPRCTLWINGARVASCIGGGYDMKGECLGIWIKTQFFDELKKLRSTDFFGLQFYDATAKKFRQHWRPGYAIFLEGATGFSSMELILNAFGFELDPLPSRKGQPQYELKSLPKVAQPKTGAN